MREVVTLAKKLRSGEGETKSRRKKLPIKKRGTLKLINGYKNSMIFDSCSKMEKQS